MNPVPNFDPTESDSEEEELPPEDKKTKEIKHISPVLPGQEPGPWLDFVNKVKASNKATQELLNKLESTHIKDEPQND